jgi:type II secretory pathway pseudopilin PulG
MLDFKSKRAITLVEMIVSIAIIALISIALLGIIIPAANQQTLAKQRSESVYVAADEMEKRVHVMDDAENKDFSDAEAVSGDDHTLSFRIGGDTYDCDGTMLQSTDEESGVTLHQFVPDEEPAE